MSAHSVRATVRVVMDVDADSVWGSDTTFEQIAKQATDDVKGMLLNNNTISLAGLSKSIRSLEAIEVRVVKEK